jgi:hypothetical protein
MDRSTWPEIVQGATRDCGVDELERLRGVDGGAKNILKIGAKAGRV